jgi:hypothetical protein
VTFVEDKSAIEKETLRKGKFIVATNLLDRENLSDEEVLTAYKEQESRIVAKVMIMGLLRSILIKLSVFV